MDSVSPLLIYPFCHLTCQRTGKLKFLLTNWDFYPGPLHYNIPFNKKIHSDWNQKKKPFELLTFITKYCAFFLLFGINIFKSVICLKLLVLFFWVAQGAVLQQTLQIPPPPVTSVPLTWLNISSISSILHNLWILPCLSTPRFLHSPSFPPNSFLSFDPVFVSLYNI